MKLSVSVGTLATFVLIAGSANAATVAYAADLYGRNEVTPVVDSLPNEKKGGAVVVYDDQTKILCGRVEYNDLTGPATGIHIHQAPTGMPNADGPADAKIIIPVQPGAVTFKAPIPAAWATSLAVGEVYANVHTAKNAKGEARGTLDRFQEGDNDPDFACDPNAPMLSIGGGGGDAGAGDAGSSSSSSSSSSSGGNDTSSSSSSSSSSGDNDRPPSDGLADPDDQKPADDSGGCNATSTAPENVLSFGLLMGLALALGIRARGSKKRG